MRKRLILGSMLLCSIGTLAAGEPRPTAAPPELNSGKPDNTAPRVADAAAFDAPAFRDAIKAYSVGQIDAGDALARRQTDPAARAALEWAVIRKARTTLGFGRLVRFLQTYPEFPMQGWIKRRAENALFDEKRGSSTIRTFFADHPPETAAGRFELALVKSADGDEAEAARLVREAWRDNTLPRSIESAILDRFPSAISVSDLRFRAEKLVFLRQASEGFRVAQPLGPGYAAALRALNASVGERPDAEALLADVTPEFRHGAAYLFAKAQTARRADKLREAARAMQTAPRQSSELANTEEWWNERRILARALLDSGDATNAYSVASGYNATRDRVGIDAQFHAGWIALRFLNDAEAAEVHFARAAEFAKTPLSISRSNYWLGRARQAMQRKSADEAYSHAAVFGATFYGQLASEHLSLQELNLRSADPGESASNGFEARVGAKAIRLLLSNDARDLALPLATDYAQTLSTNSEADALARLVAEFRDANLLLTVAKLASQRGLAMDRHAFPLSGIPTFEPLENSVESAVVYAIARQESAFDPKAVSHAGARGLMQMMPATAAATARQFKVPFTLSQLTGDPQVNARLGAAHLGHLMRTHSGCYMLVFGGYNAGPGRVREWIAAYGDPREPNVDMIDWIERIPITETRNYVQRVMENFQVYRALLTGNQKPSLRSDLAQGTRPAIGVERDPIVTGSIARKPLASMSGR